MENSEFITCKLCKEIFTAESLPPCEERLCPTCCGCCFESGAANCNYKM